MKTLLALLFAATALAGCASTVQVAGSWPSIDGAAFGPTSAADPRLRQPRFYSDESDGAAWWQHDGPPGRNR